MNWLKTLAFSVLAMAAAASPLAASSYVARVNSGYSFSFTNFGSFNYPTTNYTTSSSNTTLQTSACLYNDCGGSAPGVATATTSLTSSFVASSGSYGSSYAASAYSSSFSGVVTRYSVFGMYNFRPGTFGSTQQPVFSGGLGPSGILADPLANPEPTSIALFGAGLFALGLYHRRRAKQQG